MTTQEKFNEWWDGQEWSFATDGCEMAGAAWQEQQKKIDALEQQISKLKEENGRLTKALVFIAGCTSVYGDDSIVVKKALETGGNK